MEAHSKSINLRCVFCRSGEFALPYAEYTPGPGSFVVCANCGNENDVTSLLLFAKSVGFEYAEELAQQLMNDMTKRLKASFRNSQHIKFK